jgi:hypothetical protein
MDSDDFPRHPPTFGSKMNSPLIKDISNVGIVKCLLFLAIRKTAEENS